MAPVFELSDGKLTVQGVSLFSEVPENVSFNPFSNVCLSCSEYSDAPPSLLERTCALSHKCGFLGFSQNESFDRLINSLGSFTGKDFLSIFRFKTWWSTQWVGDSGSDLQMETQWVFIDMPQIKFYVIVIPIIEGNFRSALQAGSDGHVMICAESGSTRVKASKFDAIAYIHMSDNPFSLMKEAYGALRVYLNSFRLLEEKTQPNLVDKFGWCTWNSFYLTVDLVGVWYGLKGFSDGGVVLRFVIIDDGWQSINFDGETEDATNLVSGGEQMNARLHRLVEGDKFKIYQVGLLLGPHAPSFDPNKIKELFARGMAVERLERERDAASKSRSSYVTEIESKIKEIKGEINDLFRREQHNAKKRECGSSSGKELDYGMKAFTRDLRTEFKGLDDIYALCGAWGGVRPEAIQRDSRIVPYKLSPGLDGTMHDQAVVNIKKGSIGLVHPHHANDFYDSMHSHLAESGVTGVTVDVIHTLEYVCDEYGGRVELAKAYYDGLTNSIVKNFNESGIIASMQQCNDFFFLGTKQVVVGRVGDDFWVEDSNGDPEGKYWLQGVHMIHCSYNSLWMAQMIQPDWDMFQLKHECAKFHAGSRAICGGPIYLSDNVGSHDFDLIKKLVFPDGTVPKCIHFPLPTRDVLFKNPLFDQKIVLKIWNFNKYGGVIGAFNCQGAGWDPKKKKIRGFLECNKKSVSGAVHVTEVEWDQKNEATHMGEA